VTIAADGGTVAFASTATNPDPHDTDALPTSSSRACRRALDARVGDDRRQEGRAGAIRHRLRRSRRTGRASHSARMHRSATRTATASPTSASRT
jgi:hypothetical protein